MTEVVVATVYVHGVGRHKEMNYKGVPMPHCGEMECRFLYQPITPKMMNEILLFLLGAMSVIMVGIVLARFYQEGANDLIDWLNT
jgi:hypothetical protein